MSKDLKDILSNLSTDIDQEQLLQYLNNKLSDKDKHLLEEQLLDNDFENEALEGLQAMKNKQQINHTVEMLNYELKKKTAKKKAFRKKLEIKDQSWIYIAIFLVLMLVVMAYFVIHYLKTKGQ
jgi:glutamate synthase domain-containing protein 3